MTEGGAPKASIVVVEDEGIVAQDIAASLEDLGYEVLAIFARGEDALAQVPGLAPDLVLMDVRLAGRLDGVETARELRARHGTMVVFLTAHSDAETLGRATATEPSGYLVKPFRGPDLRCAVELALHRQQIEQRLQSRETWLRSTLRSLKEGVTTPSPPAAVVHGGGAPSLDTEVDEILRLVSAKDAEIRRLNEDLERRVVARTQELEATNRELEAFSYSVAHDLRTPLRGIDGFSQALLEDHAKNLCPEALEHLGRVRSGAQRMGRLIEDLLRLARVAKTELERAEVDLAPIALEVVTELRTSFPRDAVDVAVSPRIVVDGDARLLRIVLDNLVGNAWKFTAPVAPRRVRLEPLTVDGRRGVRISDNGVGFDMKLAARLFGAFQRLHAPEAFEGTGIGLTLAQRIVHRHGGKIWAEAAPGKGATFSFVL